MLLGASGRSSFDVSGSPTDTRALWFSIYDDVRPLGAPSGSHTTLSNGVYRRDFAAGKVLVNPTGQTQTVSLDGVYSGSGLSGVTSAVIAPTSGLVLRKVG